MSASCQAEAQLPLIFDLHYCLIWSIWLLVIFQLMEMCCQNIELLQLRFDCLFPLFFFCIFLSRKLRSRARLNNPHNIAPGGKGTLVLNLSKFVSLKSQFTLFLMYHQMDFELSFKLRILGLGGFFIFFFGISVK